LDWIPIPENYAKWKAGSSQYDASKKALVIFLAVQDQGVDHDGTLANVVDKIGHI